MFFSFLRAPRLAAAALLTAGCLGATPALAQVTTWLDNQTAPHQCDFGGAPDAATRFRTGNRPLTIEAVDIAWGTAGEVPAGNNQVGIFTNDNIANRPTATQIGGWLQASGPTQANTTMSYSGSTISLSANTEYWVVVRIVDNTKLACTLSTAFNTPPDAGAPSMSELLVGGDADAATWAGPASFNNPIYALSGTIGDFSPEDMAVTLNLPATGVVGQPYSGTYTCRNIGGEESTAATYCLISGLPDGLMGEDCTVSPGAAPWVHHQRVPAGETVTCTVGGIPTTPGTSTVTGTTGSEGDFNFTNNLATQVVTITATGAGGGGGGSGGPGGVQPVPTLSEWATILLGGFLLAFGMSRVRRQRIH